MKKHKYTLLVAAAALGALLLYAGCMPVGTPNIASTGNVIVCFGDSITQGYGVQSQESYPQALAAMTNMAVINAGIEGDTTAQALERLENDVLSRKDLLLVIIEFGANDMLSSVALEETCRNIEEMIRRVQARGAMVALADISVGFVMESYGREYRRLSRKYRTIFIPGIMNGIIANPQLLSDWMHPNVQGYRIVAHRVYRAVIPYLNQNALLRRNR